MADPLALLVLTVLWPLFPASMLFNALLEGLRRPLLRAAVSGAGPLAGVLLLPQGPAQEALDALPLPGAASLLPVLSLATALFYAWRSLSVNDLSRWAALLCTSALALLWLPWSAGARPADLAGAAFAFGSAGAALHVVARALVRRYGSDDLGRGRVGATAPRLAAMLAVTLLAALCVPPLPGFFGMLFVCARVPWWAAAGAGLVWWLWSWSGARLWQRAAFGPAAPAALGGDVGAIACALAGVLALLFVAAAYAWSTSWMS